MKSYILHIKNQTDKIIDICCGASTEVTLLPWKGKAIGVQDGDNFYIDQVIELETKRVVVTEKDRTEALTTWMYTCECGYRFLKENEGVCPRCGAEIFWMI